MFARFPVDGLPRFGIIAAMTAANRLPSIADLRRKARARIPHFVWEYLDSATGAETVTTRNRAALDRVLLNTAVLKGEIAADCAVEFLGKSYPVPFGIAPLGMSGLVWPGAEGLLAAHGRDAGIPYCLSTVATVTPEDVAEQIGQMGWFQLYPPRDAALRRVMLDRAKAAGFHTLVLTVDVPAASRRERQTRGGLTQPPRLSPRLAAQVALCPAWAFGMARRGMPRMKFIDSLAPELVETSGSLPSTAHLGYVIRTAPDLDYLKALRDAWEGHLIVKGVLNAESLPEIEAAGADAIWVSNHAGRQFDGAVAAIDALRDVRAATDLPLIFDGGIEGGLDILRALATGADFVMLGRAWHYALGALGAEGPAHLQDMLAADIASNMAQVGAHRIADLPARLMRD